MEKTHKQLLYILIFSLIIRLIILFIPNEIWWDEAIYIGIGKYLFSGGSSGYMEHIRPLLLPFILGIAWKVNIDPVLTGRIIAIASSLGTIYFTYLITKKIHNPEAGLIASVIISITYYFIFFSTKILTEIPSILLILIAINELLNKTQSRKNIIIAGIMIALAILTKYTTIILTIPILVGIILDSKNNRKKHSDTIKNVTTFLTTIIITLSPYFIYAYQKYNDPFYSMSHAITSINNAKIYYTSTILDTILQIIIQNPLTILALYGIYYYKRNMDHKKAIILTGLAMALITLITIPISILRYSLILLPFLSIAAGSGAYEILKNTKITKKINHNKGNMILRISLALIIICIISFPILTPKDTIDIQSKEDIYRYPTMHNISGPIITSTPKIAAYTDNKIIPLSWPDYAKKIYENNKKESQIILIDSCDLICIEQDMSCHKNRKELIDLIEHENTKIKETTTINCNHTIYKSSFYTDNEKEKKQKTNSLWWDEAIYMGLAENIYYKDSYAFNTKDQEKFRAPVYPITLAALFLISGPNETAPILLNIVIGILTAIATYFLAKELFHDNKISIASAILSVTTEQYIFWSSKILTEPLAILLTTTSLLIFTHITKNKRTHLYPLIGLVLAIAFLTKYPLGLLPIYFATYLLITDKNHLKQNIRQITYAAIIFLAILTPWMYNSYITYNNPFGAALFNIDQVNNLYEPESKTYYITNIYTYLPFLGILFTLGIILSTLNKKSPQRKEQIFLIGWFTMTLILLSFGIGQKFFRYILIALPSIAIISAMTLNTIAMKITKKHTIYLLTIFILIITISTVPAGFSKAVTDKDNGQIIREASDYIKNHSSKESGLMSENYALYHYYTKQPVTWYPKDTWAIDEFIKRYNVTYIIVDNYVYYPEYTENYFDKTPGFTKEHEIRDGNYFVILYRYNEE